MLSFATISPGEGRGGEREPKFAIHKACFGLPPSPPLRPWKPFPEPIPLMPTRVADCLHPLRALLTRGDGCIVAHQAWLS